MGLFDFLKKKKPIVIGEPTYIKCPYSKEECLENTSIGQQIKFYPREAYRMTLILKGSIIGEWSELNDEAIYNHLKKDGQILAKVSEVFNTYSMMELTLLDEYVSEEDRAEIAKQKILGNLKKPYNPKSKLEAGFFCKKDFDKSGTYTFGCNNLEKVNPDNVRKSIWLTDGEGNRLSLKNDTYPSECEKILRAFYSGYNFKLKYEGIRDRGAGRYSVFFSVEPFKE